MIKINKKSYLVQDRRIKHCKDGDVCSTRERDGHMETFELVNKWETALIDSVMLLTFRIVYLVVHDFICI